MPPVPFADPPLPPCFVAAELCLIPTHQVCYEYCKEEGAAYFATQYGYECWCYISGRADFDRHGDGAECDIPCEGDEV